jgi:hypothetical protein
MRRAPTIDDEPVSIEAADADFDAELGCYTLFLSVPRKQTVYFRLVVESWEDFAVARTMVRFDPGDPARSIIVVMAVRDYLQPCTKSLARLAREVGARQVPATTAIVEALRRDLLD